ncbi:esterase/lipase family protein [Streptomyces sp. KLOTTS4A1]|uniref:esterase/lipase family protein n=1 Tax=Streptomyces sp. KLOTTS4A1 TaxID=3390996 RepID=UPI0039F507FC
MAAARLLGILRPPPLSLSEWARLLLPEWTLRRLLASSALVKANVLELAILTGHVLLYPSGMIQERPHISPTATDSSQDPPRLPVGPHDRPVVLLHGFVDNRSVFVLLRRALARHGRRHLASLNYSPLTCDIREAARLLGAHVEELCERTGQREVDIVGHSLGGLIARYYVQRQGGDARVRTLVTLGTPHGGTRVVPAMDAHPIVRQMRPGSEVITELAAPAPGCRTRFVGFWSDLDQLMSPLETACVDHPDLHAHNVRVSGIGHLALPVHPSVATVVRQAIDDADAQTSTPGAASVA